MFLILSTAGIWGLVTPCCGGCSCALWRLSHISGPYQQMPATPVVTANMSPDIAYQGPPPPAENSGLYQKGVMFLLGASYRKLQKGAESGCSPVLSRLCGGWWETWKTGGCTGHERMGAAVHCTPAKQTLLIHGMPSLTRSPWWEKQLA